MFKFTRIAIGILIVIIALFLITGLFDYLYVRWVVGFFEQGLGAINWVNPHLGKAVISLVTGTVSLIAFRVFSVSFASLRRVLEWTVIPPLFLAAITHGILAFATWGNLFDQLGHSSLFYGIDDQNRVEYFNHGGKHPKTGEPLIAITSENVREVEIRRHATVQEITNPDSAAWFAPGSGKPLLWYAKRDDGLHFYNLPGYDPAISVKLKPVTTEIKALYETEKESKLKQAAFHEVTDPESVTWFAVATSKPLLWYVKRNDGVHFFNAPGFDPTTSQELKPISPEFKSQYEANKELKLKKTLQVQQEQEKADHLILLKSLWNPTPSDRQKTNVAIALMAEARTHEQAQLVDEKLPALLKTTDTSIALRNDFFLPAFTQKGFFEQAFQGDSSFLKDGGAFALIDYVLLCKIKIDPPVKSDVENVISSHLSINYRVLDKELKLVDSGTKQAVGPGLSDIESIDRAMEILFQKHSAQILKSIKPKP